ncbi:protein of unknown function [Roseivivax marinus]|uniref:DUF4386 domain-containing protein n=1 Tax=Roseivivax marinus TaxID=1379903 RepID=UPI0008CBBFE0|nr:DUF4386 domain-containing protein [Roseivivax marinus]SEK70189.1 protein of unknown function [Roseivivax marinus]
MPVRFPISADPASRSFAKGAGALYLVIAAAGFFSILWVPSQLTVPGDPAATAAQVAENRGLFLASVGGDAVMMTAEAVLSVMLYAMFRPFGAVLALAAMVARLMMAAVMAAMLLPQAGILALASHEAPLVALDAVQRAELAWVLRQAHDAGVWVWQVFFTLHLWLLGLLAWRSGAVPRVLAAGLVVGGTGYLVDSVRAVAAPGSDVLTGIGVALLAIVTLAEIGFALWLLVRGRIPSSRKAGIPKGASSQG